MDNTLVDETKALVVGFEKYYFWETFRAKSQSKDVTDGPLPEVNFRVYLSRKEYADLRAKLALEAEERGTTLSAVVFGCLTDEQKNRIGALFHEPDVSMRLLSRNQVEVLEEKVLHSEEVQDYRQFRMYLTKEQNQRLASKLSAILHGRLDEKTKGLLDQKTIITYILNMGFIQVPRVTHREAIEFVQRYKSLFQNEEDVLYHILERYVDEELTRVPVEGTSQMVVQLKNEITQLYEEIRK